jgi:hypothetical protein
MDINKIQLRVLSCLKDAIEASLVGLTEDEICNRLNLPSMQIGTAVSILSHYKYVEIINIRNIPGSSHKLLRISQAGLDFLKPNTTTIHIGDNIQANIGDNANDVVIGKNIEKLDGFEKEDDKKNLLKS